ncbi:MAG TPA: aldose 1-epimerase [Ramlibacter sp.]|uniref:aldose 1-epimerase n=1 Tax=Ramlibacter sp. TaxID=1917967 RepID=UPI002BBFD3E4|nr:aldose 1-epimerase [Ramlibacter sp.]HVZ42736.1 aldose 1-epimerase [Ramlibacter sp.]
MELTAGALTCAIEPALGGCIRGLWFDGEPVLRSSAPGALATARQSGCYALVPFSNRIGGATLSWQGTQHPLVRNNGEEPHAIHGVGWQREWAVLDEGERMVMLSYEHRPDAGWPFAFDCSQTLRVSDSGLELTLALTNQSSEPAPAGLGWHPYFTKRARSRIAFSAAGRWEMGPDKLPTVRKPSRGLDADCAFLDVDHCYDGWDGTAHLRDETLHVRVTSGLKRLVVFTNDTRDFVAIEPVSHVNNAVNLHAAGRAAEELGLTILAPGESLLAQMAIGVERAK